MPIFEAQAGSNRYEAVPPNAAPTETTGRQIVVTAPDGSTVNFPAGTSEGTINQVMTENFGKPEADMLPDVAKSAGIGLARGVIGLAGLPGDLVSIVPGAKSVSVLNAFPTSADLQKKVEARTGEFYQPQTTAGEFARTIGEFAPAAVMGPGGLARRAASVVVPGVASEAAGQATHGTDAEPYARIGAGLVGGAIPALAGRRAAVRAANEATPSLDEIKASATAGFNHPVVKQLELNPAAVGTLADDISTDLYRSGFRQTNAKATFTALDDLRTPLTPGGHPSPIAKVEDLTTTRTHLNELARERNAFGGMTPEATAASKAAGQISRYLESIPPSAVMRGDAAAAGQILKSAGQDWSAYASAKDLGARLTKAEHAAARSGSGTNIENTIRQKISQILDNPSAASRYTAAEREAMEQVVNGTAGTNALRRLGKLGFGDGLSLLLHAGAAFPSGGLSIPVGIAGTIARKAGERITQDRAAEIERAIRARSALARRQPAPAPVGGGLFGPAIFTGALASTPVRLR